MKQFTNITKSNMLLLFLTLCEKYVYILIKPIKTLSINYHSKGKTRQQINKLSIYHLNGIY